MSGENDVVYSYEADSSGIMESIDSMMEGIDELMASIQELVDASGSLSALDDAFMGVADSLAGVDAVASEAVAGIGDLADEATVASDQVAGLSDTISALSDTIAEDTALIDSLNETIVNLQAQVDMLTASEAGAEAATSGLSVSLEGLQAAQGPLMMLGMAGVAAGASMFSMGSKAEDALNQVQALAGVGASDMANYTSQLEAQATQFGESLDQEAQGLFYVTSAGFQNSDAMKVLAQSVEDAKAGHVDLSVSAKALDASLNAYGASANDATHYNDIMMTAVTKGVQTFGDFASAISKAAIAGNSAHISFDQVAAAESELTTVGMTARQASMDLSSMMKAMDSNADATAKSAKDMGLKFDEASYKTMDLFHQMSYLKEITGGNQTELTKLVGGSAGIAAFNGLMTQNSDGTYKFAQSLDNMKNSSGAAAQAFATSQDTIGAHWAKVQASLSVISYKALQDLAPVINNVADAFGKAADFLSQHMDIVMPILAGFAALITGVVVAALWMLLSPLFAITVTVGTLSAPFLAIAAVIAAAVAGIIYAIEHWGDIVGWLKGMWAGAPGFFSGLWQNIQNGVSGVGNWFKDRWQDATQSVADKFSWLYNHNYYFKSLTDSVKTATTNASNFLKSAWKTVSTDTAKAWSDLSAKAVHLWDEISAPFRNAWSQYIAPPLNSLWTNIKGLWDGFVTNASNLGKNLVQSISNGISSKAGEAGKAAQNIGDRIATLLGFHNIAGIAQKGGEGLVTAVRNMGSNAVAAARQAGTNLQSWWNGLASSFTNSPIGGAITKTLQSAFAQVGQQLGQAGSTIQTQFGNALSGMKPALDNLGNSFKLIWNDLAPIGKEIGGAFTTAWKSLQGALSQVGQVLGGAFSTAWKSLQGAFTQIGQILSTSIGPVFHALGQQLAQIGAIVGGAFSTAWKALSPIFAQIGGAIGGQLLNVLKLIGAILGGIVLLAISAVLGAIVGLAKAFATFIQGLSLVIGGVIQVFSGIIQIISGVIAFIVDLFTGHFDKLGADLGVIWKGIVTMFSGIWDIIKGVFIAGIGSVLSFFSGFFGTIVGFFVSLGDSIGLHASAAVNGVVKWFQQLPSRIMGGIQSLLGNIGGFFTNAKNAVLNAFGHVGQALMGFWDREVQGWKNIGGWFHDRFVDAKNAVISVFQHIGQALMTFWNNEVQGWKNIGGWFHDRFTDAWNAIVGIFSHIGKFLMDLWNDEVRGWQNIGGWFHDRFTEAWNNITSVFGNIGNWFHNTFTDVYNKIKDIIGNLGPDALKWAQDMINQFIQGIENGVTGVGNAVQKIAGKIASFIHFSKPDVGPLADVDNWMPDFMNLLSKGIDDNINKVRTSALGVATALNASAPNTSTLPSGPNAGGAGNDQVAQLLQKLLSQQSQRQQVSSPTSANLGAVTQMFNGSMNFNGVNDLQSLAQALEKMQGQQVIYGQRGAVFNN